MKKLGKKLSYMTKVLLVLGLLFNNLSSLSVVFAYEGEQSPEPDAGEQQVVSDFDATFNNEDAIVVTYTGELTEADSLNVIVNEKYTYTNCVEEEGGSPCSTEMNTLFAVSDEDKALLATDGMTIAYSSDFLSDMKLDGKYEMRATLTSIASEEPLGDKVLKTDEKKSDSGFEVKIYDPLDKEIPATDNKYQISSEFATVSVTTTMLAGGVGPYDEFTFEGDETVYTGAMVFTKQISTLVGFSNDLYGDRTIPVTVNYTKNGQEETYTENLSVTYGTYEENAAFINTNIDTSKVAFNSTSASGSMYIYLGKNDLTIYDLNQTLATTYSAKPIVTYTFSNADSENVVDSYNSESGQTLDEFLKTIPVDSSTQVTITDGTVTLTFAALAIGDMSGDNNLDGEDLIGLIDEIVGNEELDTEKANIYDNDNVVNVKDVMALGQTIMTGAWSVPIVEQEIELDAKLELVEEEATIISGDEFEVTFALDSGNSDINGIAGNINYDKEKLELLSLTPNDGFVGSHKDGKFIYLKLTTSGSAMLLAYGATLSGQSDVYLKAKFRALANGATTVTLDSPEYFDGATYYNIVDIDDQTNISTPKVQTIALNVGVEKSTDNSLSSLKIGNDTISLTAGTYEYKLTVPNSVETVSIEAITANVAANVTSVVSPEKLVEGDNTITITVVAENGDEKTYTVVVTREKAPEQSSNTTAYSDYNNTPTVEEPKTEPTTEPIDVEEEKKESNISKIIIIILTIVVIAGLIYLIFKDDDVDGKAANKDINKLKKEDFEPKEKHQVENRNKQNNNKNNKNKKK